MSDRLQNKENTDLKRIKKWVKPWNKTKFDDLYDRDDRFFAVITKGILSYLNENIVLYNKPINHFIFNTGSSYLYIEKNGYKYSMNEVTGEDNLYMKMPRGMVELSSISIDTAELSNPFVRGQYERLNGDIIQGFNAMMRRLPIEISMEIKYVLSNYNESIVLLQELYDKLIFQRYFYITYLGETIQCSIEFGTDAKPEFNKVDLTSTDVNQRNLTIGIKVATNYPIIDERTELLNDMVIDNGVQQQMTIAHTNADTGQHITDKLPLRNIDRT